jgi:uncharacterized membrane protein
LNKRDFINELYALLKPLGDPERNDIMRDFEEHFAAGNEKGKTDEQICRELGSPRQVAAQYLTPAQMQQSIASNPRSKTLYMIAAIALTVIFVAVVPVALGCITGSAVLLVLSFVSGVAASSWILFGLLFSISLLLFSLGMLIILVSIAIIRFCWRRSVA